MATAPSITLLHLSDLQFGPHHRFERPDAPGGLLHRLREDLDRMRDEEGLKPDLVLLTGDLTEYGLRSQFGEVLSFAHGLLEVTGLGPRRIVMVPGNHDVNWKLSEAYFAERAGNEEKPRLPYWPKLVPYAEMVAKFYEGQPGLGFTEAEPWTFYEYPELKVVVAGLDSAIAESHRPEDHHGFLGEPQLDFFAGKLRPYKERGWLRIGAVHHDPLHPENEAARQDAKDLRGRLLPWLNLVVHGHIHEEQLGWLHATTPVLGIGSAGVKVPERPPEVPNQYQWVRVFADRVEYGTRAYVPDQKRWVGSLRSDRAGKDWKLTERVAFEGVGETFSGKGGTGKAPEEDLAAMVDAYRRHWANAYRHEALFDLATMGEDADIPAGLDLLHVFLPQAAKRKVLREHGQMVFDVTTVSPPRPVDEIVADPEQRWLLVLGAPGAGKSALTRWIVLKLCVPAETLGALVRDLVPVRIELRRFDLQYRRARQMGRSYDFFDYLDELHRERHLSLQGEPLRRLAGAGRIFWLFDGLDEVPDARDRQDYACMIVAVCQRFEGHGIVTSRILGARMARPLFEEVAVATYELQDFDDERIALFLQRWHRIAFSGASDAAERRLERLLRTLQENRSVRELCGNPLLLTFVALLNRGTDLPRQRHRVYERIVELMAEHWEANKKLPQTTSVRFDLPIKKRFLRQLAFKMMTELEGGTGNVIHQRDLLAFASNFCSREYVLKPEEAQATADHLIEHLRERNHILALLGGELFGFVHKTFLEYLAAAEVYARFGSHIWGMSELKHIFRQHWQDPSWRETLTLLCGMNDEERPETVVPLLQYVLEAVHPLIDADSVLVFACSCLVELGHLDKDPMRSFCTHLTDWIAESAPFGDDVVRSLRSCESSWPEPERLHTAARQINPLDFRPLSEDSKRVLEAKIRVWVLPETEARGLLDLKELASVATAEEDSRVEAAAQLRRFGQPASEWRPNLEHLARSAKKGSDRLSAAKELLDERRIAQLARRAKSSKVRAEAASALEQIRIYRALLALGRPRRGIVSLDGTRAGVIEETPQGSRFTYDPAYLASPKPVALSATLPLRPEPFDARGLHPFFENLLPEGWLLDRTCEKLGIDRTDAFGLLLATCADCAGAVEIVPEPPPGLPAP